MRYRYRNDDELKDSGVEWISKIPKDWTVSRIDKEFKVRNEKVSDKEYPPLSVTKQGILPQLENVAKSDNSDNRKKVCIGDFVINSRADRKGSCGVSSYDGSVSLICNVLTPKKLHSQYVHSLFRNYYFSEEFYRWGSGIVDDLWSTNIEKMKKINIPIPSNNEDEKIANFLDEKTSQFDLIISKKEKLIERLEEAKKSLISEVVTGKVKVVKTDDGYELVKRSSEEMKDSGVEWIGKVAKDWIICKFKNISNFVTGGTPDRNNISSYYDNANIVWVRSTDLNNHNIYDSSEKITQEAIKQSNCKMLPKDTLVIAMYGGAGTIGKCGILKVEATTNQALCAILPNKLKYDSYFMLNLLNWIRPHWMIYAVGTRVDPNISKDIIINMSIPLPNLNEQKVIAEYLEHSIYNMNRLIDKSKLQIEKLKEAKQSLISEAVTGKIEILD